MPTGFRLVFTPEPRTREGYIAEVENYLEDVQAVHRERAAAELSAHMPAALLLRLVNESERPFSAVQGTATNGSSGVRGLDPGEAMMRGNLPELPKPPLLYGTAKLDVPGLNMSGLSAAIAALAQGNQLHRYIPINSPTG